MAVGPLGPAAFFLSLGGATRNSRGRRLGKDEYTGMSVTAAALRDLHRLHRQLSDLRERSARGPKQIRAREAQLAAAEANLTKLQNEHKSSRVAVDTKQLSLKTSEQKIKDLKAKLNACGSNREYQALKDQIAADEMAGSVLADEILEGMEHTDKVKLQVTEAEALVATAKQELAKAQGAVRDQQELLDGDVSRLEGELRTAEDALPADFRQDYNRVVKAKGEDALAMVEGESCGGCYQQLTLNIHNDLRMGRSVFCKSCGRLLYLPEDRVVGGRSA
jgi:hypothetical protein